MPEKFGEQAAKFGEQAKKLGARAFPRVDAAFLFPENQLLLSEFLPRFAASAGLFAVKTAENCAATALLEVICGFWGEA